MNTLDRIDLRILTTLQKQARITNQDLADSINLSPSSCLTRVRRLEQNGYIDSYLAKLNLNQICRNVMFIATAKIKSQSKDDFKQFEKYTSQAEHVVCCYTVSGEFDFFLQIVSPDMTHYLSVIDNLIDSIEAEITINTHVIMKENKPFTGYPLSDLCE